MKHRVPREIHARWTQVRVVGVVQESCLRLPRPLPYGGGYMGRSRSLVRGLTAAATKNGASWWLVGRAGALPWIPGLPLVGGKISSLGLRVRRLTGAESASCDRVSAGWLRGCHPSILVGVRRLTAVATWGGGDLWSAALRPGLRGPVEIRRLGVSRGLRQEPQMPFAAAGEGGVAEWRNGA